MAFHSCDNPGARGYMAKRMGYFAKQFRGPHLFAKDGAPTTDTDIARAAGDVCHDTSGDDIWRASNVDRTRGFETTTWTKVLD